MANLTEPNLPNWVRPEYEVKRKDLELVSDLLGGTRQMWDKGQERQYIRKWSDEKPEVYLIRRQCETLLEGLARVLSAAVGMLWAKPPAIEWNTSEEAMEEHWANLDGSGVAGPVLCKRFSDQSIRDGIGLILVDHPSPPETVEVITAAVAEQFNLRPVWALYSRSQVISWRVGKLNNRAVPVQVVLEESQSQDVGTYGVVDRKRYRVLRLIERAAGNQGPTDPGGPTATWEVFEETKDGTVVGGFKSIGSGVFRNQAGEFADELPIGIAYTGRTDAPFCASIPLMGVAFANLSHWRLSTELCFGRMVSAIEQPVVVGELATSGGQDGKLKLGWMTGVQVQQGGEFKWVGPSGQGLDQLEKGVREKLEQIGQMGMSFLVSDTRAAETAQAKMLDAVAENSTLATAAQGIEDAINVALQWHAWYLGIEKEGAPVLTINKDFESTVMDPTVMTAYVQAAKDIGFPIPVLLREFQRGGRIPQDVDLEELEAEMLVNAAAEAERQRQAAEDQMVLQQQRGMPPDRMNNQRGAPVA